MARVLGILLCAGESSRMGFCKLTTPLCGRTAIERSMDALLAGGWGIASFRWIHGASRSRKTDGMV